MNLAVKLYSAIPVGQKPTGIPDEWPAEVIELGEGTTLPSQDHQLMTQDQFNNYVVVNQPAYDVWYVGYKAQVDASRPKDEEFRFTTHNFADVADWEGRTNGDPAKTIAQELGAVMYNDVDYRWEDANGNSVVYLDQSVTPNVWKKASDNSIVVQYYPAEQKWKRTDNSADVTSSRWTILPYDDTYMVVKQALVTSRTSAVIQSDGALNYKIYVGEILYRDFNYKTRLDIEKSSNGQPSWKPVEDGQTHPLQILEYNYDVTVHPIIESALSMRLDIVLDNNKPITNTDIAHSTFVGVKMYYR